MEHNLITELSDEQLDELLAYTPSFSAENLDNIKNRCHQNVRISVVRKTGKRILLAAAVAVIIISLSGVALAVSTGFDFGSFYNSMFNNPDAEGIIEVGETAVSNGLEITLLSAFVDRYTAYLTIEIKDLEGGRLSDAISVLNEAFTDSIHAIFTGPVTYNEAENKATLALTVLYGKNIAELGTAAFSIDAIQTTRVRTEHELLAFDIAAYAMNSESISLDQWHDLHGGGGWTGGIGWSGDPDAAPIWEEPVRPVRPLMQGDLNVPIGGIDWAYISNIGIADGFLHIQIKSTEEVLQGNTQHYDFTNTFFCIVDGDGNTLDWYYSVISDNYMNLRFKNLMFDIGDITDFTGWRLAIRGGEGFVEDVIRGQWRIGFAVEQSMDNRILIAYPENDPIFAKLEVTCSPVRTAIQMTAHGVVVDENGNWTRLVDGYEDKTSSEKLDIQDAFISEITEYHLSFDRPYLTLDDGSRIDLENPNESFDWLGGSVWFPTDYFDIETLRSITFGGVVYYFNSNP